MDQRHEFGKVGEQVAVDYLSGRGFMILERNWRFGHKEIDIIAREANDLVVVEVKTRTAPVLEFPEQAIPRAKRQFLISAANAYVRYNRIPLEVRFDVINVVYRQGEPEVTHIRGDFIAML